ncbi:MAG: MaoC/PaaZ C-terminal domain-containing protein [Gammaproteobacteria bacterium]|nr:MaoC/PaaZ C-terminal domain-containing protein [Gammaproteobacteria bacterium]
MRVYQATARNFAEATENRIHSDEVAAQFGFAGALVAGAAVFGHMTRPLVEALGTDWLANWTADVRFLKPAYHGDSLTIHHEAACGEHTVRCHARGVLLAELTSTRDETAESEPATIGAGAAIDERPEILWDNVVVNEPFPAWTWSPDAIANAESAAQVEDDLDCYRSGVIHPNAILGTANHAFTRRYILPAWIHVGSTVRFHRLLRVDDAIEVRTVPTRKWQRKGHEFVSLDIAYLVDGAVAAEIRHVSIFRVRSDRAPA